MSAPEINVTRRPDGIRLAFADLTEKINNIAAVRALNKTATTVRAEAARRIRSEYSIKTSAAKDQMAIRRATARDVRSAIVVSGRPIPLIEFSANQTKRGVSVKIKGARKVITHAFIARMRSGHRGVFIREIINGKRGARLPIRELFSLSLPTAFSQKQIIAALEQVAAARYTETLAQEVRYLELKRAA